MSHGPHYTSLPLFLFLKRIILNDQSTSRARTGEGVVRRSGRTLATELSKESMEAKSSPRDEICFKVHTVLTMPAEVVLRKHTADNNGKANNHVPFRPRGVQYRDTLTVARRIVVSSFLSFPGNRPSQTSRPTCPEPQKRAGRNPECGVRRPVDLADHLRSPFQIDRF